MKQLRKTVYFRLFDFENEGQSHRRYDYWYRNVFYQRAQAYQK